MPTNANIIFYGKLSDSDTENKYHTVYCHYDGYVSYMMPMLANNYSNIEKIRKLISLGDMSQLDKECDGCPGHSFETPVDGQTVFFCREGGEPADSTKARNSFLLPIGDEYMYKYLFDSTQENPEWKLI